MLCRQFGHKDKFIVEGCWMNMSILGSGTHHQITNARLQYFKGWLHSRAPTLQVVIARNLRFTSLERAPSAPGNYTTTCFISRLSYL